RARTGGADVGCVRREAPRPVSRADLMFGRLRYGKVIDAQLDLFVREHKGLLNDAADKLDAYNNADRSDAEELYGDYLDVVETGTEILADMRDQYAASLEDPTQYLREFKKAVSRRLYPFALEIDNR